MEIFPSILAVWDATRGDRDAVALAACMAEQAGAVALHVDVMDGHFVPATTFGAEMATHLRACGVQGGLDVHLMVKDVLPALQPFLAPEAGLGDGWGRVVFHARGAEKATVREALRMLDAAGIVGGLALDTDDEIVDIANYLDSGLVKQVLVMTVKAGAGGQMFQPAQLGKVTALKAAYPDVVVGVDGGVNPGNICRVREAGADFAVAGSAIFGGGLHTISARLAELHQVGESISR